MYCACRCIYLLLPGCYSTDLEDCLYRPRKFIPRGLNERNCILYSSPLFVYIRQYMVTLRTGQASIDNFKIGIPANTIFCL